MVGDIWNISNMNETRNTRVNTPLRFEIFLKYLQATDPSFVTISKPLSNEIGEAFCDKIL